MTRTSSIAGAPGAREDPRLPYLRQFGDHCFSYATLQSGMKCFVVPGLGYVAYQRQTGGVGSLGGLWPRTYVLGDPVADEREKEPALLGFIQRHGHTCFLGVSAATAATLARLGYWVNCLGVVFLCELAGYAQSGGGKGGSNLRRNLRRASDVGLNVREVPVNEVALEDLEAISESWRGGKAQKRELKFLTRPSTFRHEQDVRWFFAFQGARMLGFVCFDPLYRDGSILGYNSNINRALGNAPRGTTDLITMEAMKVFRQEGKSVLSLGLSPLSPPPPHTETPKTASRTLDTVLHGMYRWGNRLYSFQGLYMHKRQYGFSEYPVYMAGRGRPALLDGIGAMEMCGLL